MEQVGVVTFVRFTSELSREEMARIVRERKEQFREIPGLIQKLYLEDASGDGFGAVYFWDSFASLAAFRDSELFASISSAYQIDGPMRVDVSKVVDTLH